MTRDLVLLTGATGRIGPHVLDALLEAGYAVRVATPDQPARLSEIEWIRTDFTDKVDYASLVKGVRHVVHLAAELSESSRMWRVNADASGALAAAAELAGVQVFLYSSSVGVYGHPATTIIDEHTPVMSLEKEVDNGFLDQPFLYDYCITKLAGESCINEKLRNTRNVMMRFSNVVTEKEIAGILHWSLIRRIWRGGRVSHQVYVKDVAAACVHLLRLHGAMTSHSQRAEVYIVSSDHEKERCYRHLFWRAAKQNRLWAWFGCPVWMPRFFDRMKDRAKFRRWHLGYPAGSVVYSPRKLMATGFVHPHSIVKVQDRVIASNIAAYDNRAAGE